MMMNSDDLKKHVHEAIQNLSGQMFSVYDITKLVRTKFPTELILHADVRKFVNTIINDLGLHSTFHYGISARVFHNAWQSTQLYLSTAIPEPDRSYFDNNIVAAIKKDSTVSAKKDQSLGTILNAGVNGRLWVSGKYFIYPTHCDVYIYVYKNFGAHILYLFEQPASKEYKYITQYKKYAGNANAIRLNAPTLNYHTRWHLGRTQIDGESVVTLTAI